MSDRRTQDPEQSAEEDSFLSRWARRKSRARGASEQELEPAQKVPGPDAEEVSVPLHEARHADADPGTEAEPEPPGDEDMPPLESIDEGASVSDFFSPRVSNGLRQAALKRLWRQSSLPVIDDLDDYAGDYTDLTPLGDIVTNEMKHRIEHTRKRLLRKAEEEAERQRNEQAATAAEEPEEDDEAALANNPAQPEAGSESSADSESLAENEVQREQTQTPPPEESQDDRNAE